MNVTYLVGVTSREKRVGPKQRNFSIKLCTFYNYISNILILFDV